MKSTLAFNPPYFSQSLRAREQNKDPPFARLIQVTLESHHELTSPDTTDPHAIFHDPYIRLLLAFAEDDLRYSYNVVLTAQAANKLADELKKLAVDCVKVEKR